MKRNAVARVCDLRSLGGFVRERRDVDRIVPHVSGQLAGRAASRRGLVYLLKGCDFPAVLCELTIGRAAVLANGTVREGHHGRSSSTSQQLCVTAPVGRTDHATSRMAGLLPGGDYADYRLLLRHWRL